MYNALYLVSPFQYLEISLSSLNNLNLENAIRIPTKILSINFTTENARRNKELIQTRGILKRRGKTLMLPNKKKKYKQ